MDEEEIHFFCNICGGPPTYKRLIKRSSLPFLHEEDHLDEHETYDDYCTCIAGLGGESVQQTHSRFCNAILGYDARDVGLKDIKWLGDVRLVTHQIPDAHLFTEKDSVDLPMVSPLAEHVDPQSGGFFYPRLLNPRDPGGNFLECNKDGFLVHDTCLGMLKLVHRDTVSATRPLDLHGFLSVMELGPSDRQHLSFDWGYGNTFHYEDRFNFNGWVPVEHSEWTVMDPNGPFDLKDLIAEASSESSSGLSFVPDKIHDESNSTRSLLSIPRELQLCILEMLPTQSVLSLFLASPHFRTCAKDLPRSFWESRLYFDVPWCADMVLAQISQQRRSEVHLDRLLYLLKEASAVAGYERDWDYLALKNRRRIWLNCERILQDIKSHEELK
ncbi:hypothetical protein CDV55_105312 [Aspergillus turcosus]|nr:hypothetical protein CDV55_105312 [Aspergillus turcosus]